MRTTGNEGGRETMDRDLHCKSLVKVHMTDITTTGSRVGQTYLSVEIGSI